MLFVVSAWRKSDISVLVISSPFWEIIQRWFLRISLKVLSHISLVGFINRKACSALSVKIIQRRQCNPDEIPTLSQTVSFSCCEIIFKYDEDYFNFFKQWNALIVQLTMKKDFMPNLECYYAVGVWIDWIIPWPWFIHFCYLLTQHVSGLYIGINLPATLFVINCISVIRLVLFSHYYVTGQNIINCATLVDHNVNSSSIICIWATLFNRAWPLRKEFSQRQIKAELSFNNLCASNILPSCWMLNELYFIKLCVINMIKNKKNTYNLRTGEFWLLFNHLYQICVTAE